MKKRNIIILIIIAAAAASGTAWGLTHHSSSSEGSVFVQKVSSLTTGTSSFNQRFSGVAESQDSVDIKADGSKKIVQVVVNQGDSVNQNDPLFVYDVSDAQSSIESTNLDVEGLNNDIAALNNEIAELTAQRSSASDEMAALQYTTEIQSKQTQIRQDQLDIQSKKNSIAKYQQEIDQATVKAPISGVVKSVNASGGTDPNSGQELPVVSIAETGTMRIKGTVDEQNISLISSGMAVTVRSRIDENETWNGTVTSVETDPQSNTNSDYSSDSSGDSSSKYTFYASLENSDGLMLGQHVYVEPGESGEVKTGIWLDNSFVVSDEDGSTYVWKAENDRLVKQIVETGELDESDYTVEILSGLSEEDEIAYPDSSYTEGMTVERMESEG